MIGDKLIGDKVIGDKVIGDMMEYNDIFRERTKKLALEIVREMAKVKFSDEVSVIRKQIIRSATSVAANYRAVCRA